MTMQTWILVAVFLSVAGLTWGIGLWLTKDKSMGLRLGQLISGQPDALDKPDKNNEASQKWRVKIAKIAAPIARLSTPKEGWESSNFRVRFMRAGLRGAGWPLIFFGSKTLLALALPGLFMLYGGVGTTAADTRSILLLVLLLAALGYYLPNILLSTAIRSRQRELRNALPDAIDLMTVCVEAGLALDAAMSRAGEEMNLRSLALADELNLVTLELRIGSTRARALQNLAVRTGVDDIATFVTMLLQSERFGTSVADALRVLAETMRDHRRIRAEEAAAKIPLKMLFPLIFFIFPSLFLVLIGPAMISIYRTLMPMLSGH